jgi:hypothetical protein
MNLSQTSPTYLVRNTLFCRTLDLQKEWAVTNLTKIRVRTISAKTLPFYYSLDFTPRIIHYWPSLSNFSSNRITCYRRQGACIRYTLTVWTIIKFSEIIHKLTTKTCAHTVSMQYFSKHVYSIRIQILHTRHHLPQPNIKKWSLACTQNYGIKNKVTKLVYQKQPLSWIYKVNGIKIIAIFNMAITWNRNVPFFWNQILTASH